ncbi:MAG: PD-(D/E)XK nuclease family protein, partial [Eggerthellaceae bacterium]|nr:PD-(D/E)XK nuclease family protein [Eggerthellaceae bacterium]
AESPQNALIIDYKTGAGHGESEQELLDKYRLQAQCYALAAINAGYDTVELVFVRVEQHDAKSADQPAEVHYRFCASDEDKLQDMINSSRTVLERQVG